MTSQITEVGLPDADAEYTLRPGGYAVIFSPAGEVAVVMGGVPFDEDC